MHRYDRICRQRREGGTACALRTRPPWPLIVPYEIFTSATPIRTGIEIGAGWAGAFAGAKLGAMAGGGIGSIIAPGVGTVIGGVVGGFVGGISGYFGARWAAHGMLF